MGKGEGRGGRGATLRRNMDPNSRASPAGAYIAMICGIPTNIMGCMLSFMGIYFVASSFSMYSL